MTQIRPLQVSDDKTVRFAIGKAAMESLAVANRRVYTHPLTISTWLLLSFIIIRCMDMWPTNRYGLLGYLHPVPILAASAVPIMFLIDWLNRAIFEKLTHQVLRGPDMSDLLGYYSRSLASGFWILSHDGLFVGLIAIDASMSNESPNKLEESYGERGGCKGPTTTATIRHFYVDEAYRRSGVQEDLLKHAVQFAFSSDKAIQRIRAFDSSLSVYIQRCLQDTGFSLSGKVERVGVFRWKLAMKGLDRDTWVKGYK